jgi:ribosomal protein S6--L-glutamate ligase
MRVCLITSAPDHPLLAAVTALLSARHQVITLDPGADGEPSPEQAERVLLADVCLLKSRTARAISLAASLEAKGVPVLNSASATALCQDRTKMAALAHCAGLPFAGTRTMTSLAELVEVGEPVAPLVIKSRHSRSADLVARADDVAAVGELAEAWPEEPVVVQEFTENSGWDHKLWAVGDQLFAGLRRSELSPESPESPEAPHSSASADSHDPTISDGPPGPPGPLGPPGAPAPPDRRTHPLTVPDLPEGWAELVLRVGQVFGLDIYGVDILDAGGGKPLIVDINAFPGIRGQPGAPEAVADLALGTATAAGLAGGARRKARASHRAQTRDRAR